MSLLAKARAIPRRKQKDLVSDESIELAVAWANGEVGTNQTSETLGIKPSNRGTIYCWLAKNLGAAIVAGKCCNRKSQ